MIATGFLLGFSEGLAYGRLIEHQASTKMLACLNGGVNGAQVRAVMDKDIRDHPETWNSPMLMKLAQALEAICPVAASNAAATKSKK